MKKNLLSTGLVLVAVVSSANISVSAKTVPIKLTAAATPVDVQIPEELHMNMESGTVQIDEVMLEVKNNSNVGVLQVSSIELNAKEGWEFVPEDSTFNTMSANSKKLFLTSETVADQSLAKDKIIMMFNGLTINSKSSRGIPLTGKTSIKTSTLNDAKITEAVLTMNYTTADDDDISSLPADNPVNPSLLNYALTVMDKNTPTQTQAWVVGNTIIKNVYATAAYSNSANKSVYDSAMSTKPTTVFSDTWVRFKIEETLTGSGTKVAKTLQDGKLVSAYSANFELIRTNADTRIITLDEWDGIERGRFWILDESTGWLYWAQPVKGPTKGVDLPDQTTDSIMNNVKLHTAKGGTWTYQIKATMDAFDYELDGYAQGAWGDVASNSKVAKIFKEIYDINSVNFPDAVFRNYIKQYDVNGDKRLDSSELAKVTMMNLYNKGINNLKGIEYFTSLDSLHLGKNNLTSLNVSKLTKLTDLSVYDNKLAGVTLTGLTSLKTLDIRNNRIASINVTGLTGLTTFKFDGQTSNGTDSIPLTPVGW